MLALLLLMAFCCACSTAVTQRGEYLAAYKAGDLAVAEEVLDTAVHKALPCRDFRSSKDAVWLLLDRATIRFAAGDTAGAISDYNTAIEAIDYYSQKSPVEYLQQVALEDDCEAYSGEDFEQVLARVYFALALMHQGDHSNAYAMLRQAEDVQQRKTEMYASSPLTADFRLVENSVAKYLLAALSENKGDVSNARILYAQAAGLSGFPTFQFDANTDKATVIIVCHNGNAPFKVTGYSEASRASALALEIILAQNGIPPAISTMTGIPVPVLMQTVGGEPLSIAATLDGQEKPLLQLYDVGATASEQLSQQMPLIVARGVARLLLRRATVGYGQERDPGLGMLLDIGMTIANATTKADTRSWATLPNTIDIARYDVESGDQELKIVVDCARCPLYAGSYHLRLKPHDLCIINIFNVHPCVTHVLIPEQFRISNKGDSL